ncbi:hypothetical protein [Vibrio vulnificus]|uniref:hypothetical protein n=1 Tax=Vibrio vulnificus TaxID=672 RepID=UPI00102A99A1|nr:hypothetical protein [Vibrio vulnificus]RZP88970.1 hypothetical protein D8T54_20295 [Vibrio vulnificus]
MSKRLNLGAVSQPVLKTMHRDDEDGVFSMSLRDMPVRARNKFKRLKKEGKITGSMNEYMRRAFMSQLDRDDM